MRNPATGISKVGVYGFSWTTLFFTGLPALFRGDIMTGLAATVFGICTSGLATLIWAFFYNEYYTTRLLDAGYVFDDTAAKVADAKATLGIKG